MKNGLRRNPTRGDKPHTVYTHLTDAEHEALLSQCEKMGISKAMLLRSMLRGWMSQTEIMRHYN